MKNVILLLMLSFTMNLFAHDGGHGPALRDESFHGGKVTAVINKSEVNKGRKAKMIYKGELVHNSQKLDVKLYLYDKNMKALDLTKFGSTVEAVQIERRTENTFKLTLDKSKKFFVGKRPKNKRVPFNIDVIIKDGDKSLFAAFDGLD